MGAILLMKRIPLYILSLLVVLSFSMDAAAQKKTVPGASAAKTCGTCHKDFSKVLPGTHPPVSGKDLQACISCHDPSTSGKAEVRPYSARIHLAHVKPARGMDCTDCHTWKPGQSFGLRGTKLSYGKPSKEDMDLMKKVFSSWAESSNLDALHGKKNVDCGGCHGTQLPVLGDTVENDRCLACHGSLENLVAKTAPKDFPDRNPHKSHLGDINCTVCHKTHEPSKVYCLECHPKFQMQIPGAAKQ